MSETSTPAGDKPATKDKKTEKTTEGAGASPEAKKDPAKNYSRGENQKPVSERYRSNWDAIFGKKK